MKAVLMVAGAALTLAGCETMDDDMVMTEPAVGTSAYADQPMAVSESARQFAMMSASGNMFEIESSRLALERSQNPAVRQFAEMMIRDHTQALNQLQGAASQLGMQLPMQMSPQHQQMLDSLRNTPMGNFNMAYHQAQVMAHQEAISLHRGYAANGDNPTLRNWAGQVVPTLEMHAQQLEQHRMHWMDQQPGYQPGRAGERG